MDGEADKSGGASGRSGGEPGVAAMTDAQSREPPLAAGQDARLRSSKPEANAFRSLVECLSEGAVIADSLQVIRYANARFRDFLALDPAEVLDRPLWRFVAPEQISRLSAGLERAGQTPRDADFDLVGMRGRVPVHCSMFTLDAPGWEGCTALIFSEMSLVKRAVEVREAADYVRSIVEQAADPVIVCDGAGIVTHASAEAQRICVWSPIGRPFAEAFPLRSAQDGACFAFELSTTVHGIEVEMTARHGVRRHFLASIGPVRNGEGKGVGSVVTLADIAAVKRQQEELRKAKAEAEAARVEAEKANIAKSHFLAAASHDLRQPFQALRLFVDILGQQVTDPRQRRVVEAASDALSGGESLLQALLDVSRFDAGAVKPNIGAVALDDVLKSLANEWAPPARDKGLAFKVVACSASVVSDPVLLSRILRNFLQNAVKYTQTGTILLGCRRVGAAVSIEVWDTGIGIAEAEVPRIFDDFYQIGNDGRDHAQGLGIGLSVVRRMAMTLGHRLSVRSVPGRGSVFAVVAETG